MPVLNCIPLILPPAMRPWIKLGSSKNKFFINAHNSFGNFSIAGLLRSIRYQLVFYSVHPSFLLCDFAINDREIILPCIPFNACENNRILVQESHPVSFVRIRGALVKNKTVRTGNRFVLFKIFCHFAYGHKREPEFASCLLKFFVEEFITDRLVNAQSMMRAMTDKSQGRPFPVCIMSRSKNYAAVLMIIVFKKLTVYHLYTVGYIFF